MSMISIIALLASLATSVTAHGHVQGIVADGVWYEGYSPSFQYTDPAPIVIGWSDPKDLSNGYIAPDAYSTADIICHLSATPGGTAAPVAAGGKVELQWTAWPESHHGPVLNYLARAGDTSSDFDWSSVDKTTLEFVKIEAAGLIDDTTVPGTWASDQLIANNNSWVLEIPSTIAPGNYVLRHEIIALHSAGTADGAQNYPQCINLEISGSGSAKPSGTLGEKLYTDTAAPGIVVNIYESLSTYEIPGPTLWSGAMATVAQTTVAITGDAAASTGSSTSWVAATTAASTSTTAATSAVSSTTSAPYAPVTTSSLAPSKTSATTLATQPSMSSVAVKATSETTVMDITTAKVTDVVTAAATNSAIAPSATGDSAALGGKPSKPLPEGFTLQDLLQWSDYLMAKAFRAGDHQKDFQFSRR